LRCLQVASRLSYESYLVHIFLLQGRRTTARTVVE
jgi:hypothetical protein